MVIEIINIHKIKDVAILHKKIFGDHLLGEMPVNLLYKFYKEFLSGPEIIFLTATENDKLIGFILGGKNLNDIKNRFLRKNFLYFILSILKSGKALKLFYKSYVNKDITETDGPVEKFRLLSIGVSPEFRGQQVADKLVTEFEHSIIQKFKGVTSYGLSVHNNNLRAINFYKKMGFMPDGKKTKMSIFLKKIL